MVVQHASMKLSSNFFFFFIFRLNGIPEKQQQNSHKGKFHSIIINYCFLPIRLLFHWMILVIYASPWIKFHPFRLSSIILLFFFLLTGSPWRTNYFSSFDLINYHTIRAFWNWVSGFVCRSRVYNIFFLFCRLYSMRNQWLMECDWLMRKIGWNFKSVCFFLFLDTWTKCVFVSGLWLQKIKNKKQQL